MFAKILLSIFILSIFFGGVSAGGGVTQESLRNNLLEFSVSETVIDKIDEIIDSMSTEQLDILLEKSDILIHKYRHDGFYSAILHYLQFQAINKKNIVLVKKGDYIYVHYTGYLIDGEKFDSSYDRGMTLDFTVGAGQMISGFDNAVIGMNIGEKKTVIISPKDAYGEFNIESIQYIPRSELQSFIDAGYTLEEGEVLPTQFGEFTIISTQEDGVTINTNHYLAGQTLTFDIEIIDIRK